MKNVRQLLQESDQLLEIAEKVQDETLPLPDRQARLKELSDVYHAWYRSGIALFDLFKQSEERKKFEQEYAGSAWSNKILKFVTAGLDASVIYIPDNPFASEKYQYPFLRCFKEPLLKQCNLLANLEVVASNTPLNSEEDASWNTAIRRVFTLFLEKAENAKTNNEKKLSYEYLAMFLMGVVEGLTVIGHDARGASEEIDLWIANEAKDGFWQQMGNIFIVECKNWVEPVGVQQVRNLKAIMDDKNVQLAILISKNGVTGDTGHDAVGAIHNAFRDGKYIIVLDQTDLQEIAKGTHPTKQIKKKYHELIMKS